MAAVSNMSTRSVVVVLIIICLVMISSPAYYAGADAAITCGTVLSGVSSCLGYLQRGGPVSIPCCDGLSSVYKMAATTPDLQAACRCIKSLVPSVGAKAEFVNSLPGICHVNIPYKYSPSLDCSKIGRG